jgi:hypothetical protein
MAADSTAGATSTAGAGNTWPVRAIEDDDRQYVRFDRELADGKLAAAMITSMYGLELAPPFFKIMPRRLLASLTEMAMKREDSRATPDASNRRRVEFPGLDHGASSDPSTTNPGGKPEIVAQVAPRGAHLFRHSRHPSGGAVRSAARIEPNGL